MRPRAAIAVLLVLLTPLSTFAQTMAPRPVITAATVRRAVADLPHTAQAAPTAACDDSRAKGRLDAATMHSGTAWFVGGVGVGVLLGLIGTGIITGAAALGNPQPKQTPAGLQTDCYREGFTGKAKNKNVVSAVLGGVIGAVVWAAIYFASQDDDVYYYRARLAGAR